MRRNWIAKLVIAGGLSSAMFGQYPPNQGDPNDNGQYGSGPYDDGQYGDPGYDSSYQGVYAPAPPPPPVVVYRRPPMPGPGYFWVDGYWNFIGGRYAWVAGYWMLPPYAGGYWVPPRYSGGRFFLGFWGGGRRDVNRGFVSNGYRSRGYVQAPRPSLRPPARGGFGYQGGNDRRGGRR